MKKIYNNTHNFHLANSYGLFSVVTMRRPEIIISGSNDGQNWKAYSFRYKPGDSEQRKGKDSFWERKLLPNHTVQGRVDQLLAQLEANGIIQAKQ